MSNKAFTLVELVIVAAIVILLAVISTAIYRGYLRDSVSMEGKGLVNDVFSAEQVHRTRNGAYLAVGSSSSLQEQNSSLGVDFKSNKYFNQFYVAVSNTTNGPVTVITNAYEGRRIKLIGKLNGSPTVTEIAQ